MTTTPFQQLRVSTFLTVLLSAMVALVTACSSAPANRQAAVHEMGGQVMPFDLSKTIHSFQLTVDGGIQEVRIRAATDDSQLGLVRHHLQHEAMLFSAGQYSDPAALHGEEMPGLKALAAGADRMVVEYTELADGARLIFRSKDPSLVLAVHQWFAAQLSDHGSDAVQLLGP